MEKEREGIKSGDNGTRGSEKDHARKTGRRRRAEQRKSARRAQKAKRNPHRYA